MLSIFEFARENGWPETLARVVGALHRRLRDRITARRLGAPGFRVGRHPRLLGLAHMHVGKNVHAGDNVWLDAVVSYGGQRFEPRLVIGDNVNLSDRVHLACLNSIVIGEGTLVGSRVIVSDHTHGVYRGDVQSSPKEIPARRPLSSPGAVVIGRNVWLGDGVAVLAGAVIGDGAIIGANSVVTGTIPPATIAVGAPARPIRRWDAEQKQWVRLSD